MSTDSDALRHEEPFAPGMVFVILVVLLAVYVLYYSVLADRMHDYVRDIEKHFEFARPLIRKIKSLF